MLKNYLTVALRAFARQRGFSSINVAGLAVGMASAVLILLAVRQDLSYDGFHEHGDRIFRVLTYDAALGVSSQRVGITLPALGPAMAAELPEVEGVARMGGGGRQLVTFDGRDHYVEQVRLAEQGVLELFSFPLLAGDARTALTEPNTVVVSRSLAERVFGDTDPVGEVLRLNHEDDVRVVGVVADPPLTSSLQFDMLYALVPAEGDAGMAGWLQSWSSISMTTFVRLRDPAAAEGLVPKMNDLLRRNDVGDNFTVGLQPLGDVHLGSSDILFDTTTGQRDRGYVYGLAAVGVLVLMIACFNFMNLATARAADRAKEVGLRKAMGATRGQLVGQHLGEAVVLVGASFALALALVALALPFVREGLGWPLTFGLLLEPQVLLALLGLTLLVGLLAGSYPAFVLSRFEASSALRGLARRGTGGARLRRVLVVAQFAASVVMIVGALVVSRQLDYIMERDAGYDREQVLVLEAGSDELQRTVPALSEALRRLPGVRAVARATAVPGQQVGRTSITPEGADAEDPWIVSVMSIDDAFVPTLDIELAAGRNFSQDFGADTTQSVLINEAAMRAFGWQEAVGKTIDIGADDTEGDDDGIRTVVGVLRDFEFASVRHQVEPLMLFYAPRGGAQLAVKVRPEGLRETVAGVERAWEGLNPGFPFEYRFLDEAFAEQYREEATFALLARAFTGLAILIACLGLLGLAAYTAQQRTKEIGVRKVLGASVPGLVALLSRDFLVLVGVAFVVAVPVAWYAMSGWLSGFAYRVGLGPGVFLAGGALALGIALATVATQALRAATADPVRALRAE